MTEESWLACADPIAMLRHLQAGQNTRKPLLFTCACLARLGSLLPADGWRWVEVAQRVAEGQSEPEQLPDESGETALNDALEAASAAGKGMVRAAFDVFYVGWQGDWWSPEVWTWEDADDAAWEAERRAQADLVRDVFGNPFRPARVDPSWRSRDVRALAQTIYDEGAFDRLGILADALEDAGCTSADVLEHLRGPGPHTRGCWIVDLLLGKG
jgi:hypothetical protein